MEADIRYLKDGHGQLENALNRMVDSQERQTASSEDLNVAIGENTKAISDMVTQMALSNERTSQLKDTVGRAHTRLDDHEDRVGKLERQESKHAGAMGLLKWVMPFLIVGVVATALVTISRIPNIGG